MFNLQIEWDIVAGSYAMFHAIHGIVDYWVQTDWQAKNKTKNLIALWLHITTYSACFIPAGLLLYISGNITIVDFILLPFVVGLPHAWMDRRKFLTWFCEKTKGWKTSDIPNLSAIETAVRVHVTIHMDQKFHYACLFITALWLGVSKIV